MTKVTKSVEELAAELSQLTGQTTDVIMANVQQQLNKTKIAKLQKALVNALVSTHKQEPASKPEPKLEFKTVEVKEEKPTSPKVKKVKQIKVTRKQMHPMHQ